MTMSRRILLSLLLTVAVLAATHAGAATLHVGAASCDITPDMPSFLHGQQRPRVAKEVEYPVTANILALESREGDHNHVRATWNARVVARYERLKDNPRPMLPSDVNVLRIGETVICTNQFELFIDFAIQIKARSPAIQTFVVQLANGSRNPEPPPDASEIEKAVWHYASSNTYLPTDRAMKGGGYSANAQSIIVGPEGGQVLVEETLKMINGMW